MRRLLAGLRTPGHRLFGSAALGYASASHCRQRGKNSSALVDRPVGALAYDAVFHASYRVVGLGFALSGNAAPAGVTWSAATLSFELGWFGQ